MQVACEMTDEDMRNLQTLACVVIFICFVIAAIYYEVITNREDNGLLRIRRFDIQTCTASDYSVRINLSDDWYEAYKREDERRLSEGRHK